MLFNQFTLELVAIDVCHISGLLRHGCAVAPKHPTRKVIFTTFSPQEGYIVHVAERNAWFSIVADTNQHQCFFQPVMLLPTSTRSTSQILSVSLGSASWDITMRRGALWSEWSQLRFPMATSILAILAGWLSHHLQIDAIGKTLHYTNFASKTKTFGRRVFVHAVPKPWNFLPEIRIAYLIFWLNYLSFL